MIWFSTRNGNGGNLFAVTKLTKIKYVIKKNSTDILKIALYSMRNSDGTDDTY